MRSRSRRVLRILFSGQDLITLPSGTEVTALRIEFTEEGQSGDSAATLHARINQQELLITIDGFAIATSFVN